MENIKNYMKEREDKQIRDIQDAFKLYSKVFKYLNNKTTIWKK